jgi:putative hydrolase of the HAD superfamily
MIKNIIFDLGGVIIRHKPALIADILLLMHPKDHEKALEIWEDTVRSINSGKITSRDFMKKLKQSVDTNLNEEELYKLWNEEYIKGAQDLNQEVIEIIKSLQGKYNLYLLTDTIDIHDEYNSTRGIYDLFDKTFRSYLEGYSKHYVDAFTNILTKTEAIADETLFIDDLPENIKLAQSVGIHGIVFIDANKLLKDLNLHGINP